MGTAQVVRLPAMPGVAGLMARAVLPGSGRPPATAGLPERIVVVERYLQDPDRLAAYSRVTGFGIRDAVPATWLHVLTFPLHLHVMAQSDFPFPLAGVLHASNEMTLHRPVAVSEPLTIEVTASGLAPHRLGAAFDLVGTVRVGDETVWTGRSVYLAKGRQLPGEPPTAAPRLAAPDGPASQKWNLPSDLGRRYAEVSGDSNPIHLHPLTAMPFGLKRPIIHGMWTHARALSALGPLVPDAFTVKVTFTKPISLPGRVWFSVAQDETGARFAVVNSDQTQTFLVGALTHQQAQ